MSSRLISFASLNETLLVLRVSILPMAVVSALDDSKLCLEFELRVVTELLPRSQEVCLSRVR